MSASGVIPNEMYKFQTVGLEKKKVLTKKVIDIHAPLIEGCKRNEVHSQKQLYDLFSIALFNTCKRMTGNREEAQDILQDTFVDAFRTIQNFQGKSSIGTWLKRIAINKCINHLERKKILIFEKISEKSIVAESTEPVVDEWTSDQISDAILELPTGCRSVFVMKALEGYDHKEIASYLKISIGTSKSQFSRARLLLQDSLKNLQK